MATAAVTCLPQPASKIGIDGDALRKPLSGVGQYVFNLCKELDRLLPSASFFVYTRLAPENVALPSERWVVRQEPHSLARKIPSFAWLKTRGAALARRDNLDVFWAGRTIHPGKKVARRIVVTVHDLNHRLVPKTMEWATRLSHILWFDRDVRSADAIFTNSQGTSDRLQHWVGRSADLVIHPGVRPDFHPMDAGDREIAEQALAPRGIRPPYLLAVSTLEPRKNIGILVSAFVKLKEAGLLHDHQLVLVGAKGWQNKELAQKISDNAALGIVLPGYVPDELMPAVFALADVLVMPSLYEGFGMPVLEARAVGTPVIVSDIPELKEAADGQGRVVVPDLGGIENALKQMPVVSVEDRQRAYGEIFTWAKSAQRMVGMLLPA
ncbi:glycosyltransferase family 4 protein [Pseudomonas turukhanskensis]|uniref:Glycosyl transferase family 1 n=1 Tax=Pseudomonas turukhanskensis TaxID=1806536 RepID=A0A9W6NET5_9PSED|nr:glycosyltransferase family 1 protein [Pseudomonas turukhanskensis]GLK88107.1 glycosyl transferase family 1 [Pseudomonas turukhanskensis]